MNEFIHAEAAKNELAGCTRMVKDIIWQKNKQDPGIPVLPFKARSQAKGNICGCTQIYTANKVAELASLACTV